MELRRMSYTAKGEDGALTREQSDKWYGDVDDLSRQRRRIPLDSDKSTAKEYANKIDKLNKVRGTGDVLTDELSEFIKTVPPPIRNRLGKSCIVAGGGGFPHKTVWRRGRG